MRYRFALSVGAAILVVLAWLLLRVHARLSSSAALPIRNAEAAANTQISDGTVSATSEATPVTPNASGTRVPEQPETESEATMMATLRATLGKGTPQATLDLARRLEQLYPDGEQAEERSLYAIDALIALNRIGDMRDEARRHLQKWQGSSISSRVEARTGVHPQPKGSY